MNDDVDFTDSEGREVHSHGLIKEVLACPVPQTYTRHLFCVQVLCASGPPFITN